MKLLKVLFILTLFFTVSNHVHAQEGNMPYSISLIPPEQQTEQSSYFNLEVTPGETVTLEVEIENPTDEPIVVKATVNDALTSGSGFITYNGSGTRNETMTHPFSELAVIEDETVEVSPNSIEIAAFEVQVPKESFDGVILGGLHFVNEGEASEEAALQVDNLFAYEVAVQMQEAGNDASIEPEFGWHGASAGIHNHREVVMAGISNDVPLVAGATNISTEISQDGEMIYETTVEDAVFAPDSLMEWPIYIAEANLDAGEYDIEVVLERGEEEWTFGDSFTITEKEREEIDEGAIADETDEESGMNWLVLGLLAVVALLTIAVIFLLFRMRRQGRE